MGHCVDTPERHRRPDSASRIQNLRVQVGGWRTSRTRMGDYRDDDSDESTGICRGLHGLRTVYRSGSCRACLLAPGCPWRCLQRNRYLAHGCSRPCLQGHRQLAAWRDVASGHPATSPGRTGQWPNGHSPREHSPRPGAKDLRRVSRHDVRQRGVVTE